MKHINCQIRIFRTINNWINNNEEVLETIQLNDIEIFDQLDINSWWEIDPIKRNSRGFMIF